MKREKILKNFNIFQSLDRKSLQILDRNIQEQKFTHTDFIIQNGEPGSFFYLIKSGEIKVIYSHNIEHIYKKGDFFGELALLSKNSAVIHALPQSESGELFAIENKDFFNHIKNHPELGYVLNQITAIRLASIGFGGYNKDIGSYRILEKLTQTNEAVVFKGEHALLKRPVFISMLPHHFMQDDHYKKILLNMVKVTANLDLENIVTPIDIIPAYSTYFLISPYNEVISVAELLQRCDSIPLDIAYQIILQTAGTLSTAHNKSIIHKGLTEDNVFITPEGSVQISNFGIVHPNWGNFMYMSPEHIKKDNLVCSSDIYSFGVLCYKLLTGNYPYSESDLKKLALQKAKGEFTPLKQFSKEVPPELIRLVERSLEPKAEKRLQSLYNIEEILKLWAEEKASSEKASQKESSYITGTLPELKKWLKKKRLFKKTTQIKQDKIITPAINDIKIASPAEDEDNIFIYKIANLQNILHPQKQKKTYSIESQPQQELMKHLYKLENERQELILLHTLTRQFINVKSRQEIFLLLNKALALIEKHNSYAIITQQKKNQAKRIYASKNYLPDGKSDINFLEKAAKNSTPVVINHKKIYVLLCPLICRDLFIGVVSIAHSDRKVLDTRLPFYSLLADITGVVVLLE